MSIQLDRTTPHAVDSTTPEAQPMTSASKIATAKTGISTQDEIPVSSTVVQEKSDDRNGAPALPPPSSGNNEYVALPALGAAFMKLITETQSQQRRLSAQQRALETDLTCANMNEQADKIRSKAVTGLVFGIVTSSLSIGQAVVTSCTMQKGLSQIKEQAAGANPGAGPNQAGANRPGANIEIGEINPDANPNANLNNPNANPEVDVNPNANPNANADVNVNPNARHNAVDTQNQQMLLNQKIAMQNTVFSAGITSLSKSGEAVSGFMDVDIKRSEINIERSRANVDALRALEESSQAVITKALAAMDAIQSSTNQAMQRILG